MREDPDCPYCAEVETMEHLYFGCEFYSELQWVDLCKYITQYIRQTYDPHCPEIWITYRNIIFNEEIKNLNRRLPSKSIRKFIQLLIHEIRRDIYFRKMNHVTNNNMEVSHIRRKAHLIIVLEKTISYLEYLGLAKWTQAINCAKNKRKHSKWFINGPLKKRDDTAQHTAYTIHTTLNTMHTRLSLHSKQHWNTLQMTVHTQEIYSYINVHIWYYKWL